MKSRHGRIWTVLIVTVLAATALAGGALAALMAHQTTAATKIAVTEVNYKIKLAKHSFKKGKATFVIHNTSGTVHQFKIKGPGVSKMISAVNPGATKKLTVTLKKGTYTLSCPLHVALGMKTTIKVAGGSASGGTTTSSGGWG
jgi:plastocyanin